MASEVIGNTVLDPLIRITLPAAWALTVTGAKAKVSNVTPTIEPVTLRRIVPASRPPGNVKLEGMEVVLDSVTLRAGHRLGG
jgi:hypothetical protein